MTKLDFILALQKELTTLPKEDVQQRLTFYSEMIDDRVEEGISEEDAVAQIGSVEEIAAQILAEYSAEELASVEEIPAKKEEKSKRRIKTWERVLLILGSPLWLSLVITILAVAFSIVVSVLAAAFSVIVSLWAVFVSLIVCAFALPVAAIYFICIGYGYSGLATIGAGLFCGGLAILFFYACKGITKGIAYLTVKIVIFLKNRLKRKEKE